jgi:hypothetical protein
MSGTRISGRTNVRKILIVTLRKALGVTPRARKTIVKIASTTIIVVPVKCAIIIYVLLRSIPHVIRTLDVRRLFKARMSWRSVISILPAMDFVSLLGFARVMRIVMRPTNTCGVTLDQVSVEIAKATTMRNVSMARFAALRMATMKPCAWIHLVDCHSDLFASVMPIASH